MRTLKQSEFTADTYTVLWRACERCGAPGPCLIQLDDDGVDEVQYIGPTGCCDLRGRRPIAGDRRIRKAAV
jgi:hypothetical protein